MKKLFAMLMAVALLISCTGCNSSTSTSLNRSDAALFDEITQEAKSDAVTAINSANDELGYISDTEVQVAYEDVPSESTALFSSLSIPGYEKQYYKVVASLDASGLTSFDSSGYLYLGSLLTLSDPTDISTLAKMNLDYNKITLVPDNEGTAISNYTTVTVENSMAAVKEGINEIFTDFYGDDAILNVQYTIASSVVQSDEDVANFLGLTGAETDNVDVNNFTQINEDEVTVVLAVKQIYGSVSVDFPNSTGDWLAEDVTVEEYEAELARKSYIDGSLAAPLVVSRVSYGRIALVKVTADIDQISGSELETALMSTFNATSTGATVSETNIEYFNELIDSINGKAEYFIWGGSTDANTDLIEYRTISDMYAQLLDYNSVTSEALAASPIEYTLSHLDGTRFSSVPVSVYYNMSYIKIDVTDINYNGTATFSNVNGTLVGELSIGSVINLNKSAFVATPSEAVVDGLVYEILTGPATVSATGVLSTLSYAEVGDKIILQVYCDNSSGSGISSGIEIFEITIVE
ncbi:MAG: thiol-activated cytolysin family protein [Bacillota bacterium]